MDHLRIVLYDDRNSTWLTLSAADLGTSLVVVLPLYMGDISFITRPLITSRLTQPTNPFLSPVCCCTSIINWLFGSPPSLAEIEGTDPRYKGPLKSRPCKRPSGTVPRTTDSLWPSWFNNVRVPFLRSLVIRTVCHCPKVIGFLESKIAGPVPTSYLNSG